MSYPLSGVNFPAMGQFSITQKSRLILAICIVGYIIIRVKN